MSSHFSDSTNKVIAQINAVCAGNLSVEVNYWGNSLIEVSTPTHSAIFYLPTLAIAFEEMTGKVVSEAVLAVITAVLRSFAGTITVSVNGADNISPILQADYYEICGGVFVFYQEDNCSCGAIESNDLYNWLLTYRLEPVGLVAQLAHQFDLV